MKYDEFDPRRVRGPFTEATWDFESAEVNWMLDYWQDLRGSEDCPRWSDVDLVANFSHAPKIVVKDAIDGGKDFRNRYWGSDQAKWLQFEGTGKLLSDYFPSTGLADMIDAHRRALLGDIPIRRTGISQYPNRDHVQFECIFLPLKNDQGERAHVISLGDYRTIPKEGS